MIVPAGDCAPSLRLAKLLSGTLKSPHVTRLQLTLGVIEYVLVQFVVADFGAEGSWYAAEPTR